MVTSFELSSTGEANFHAHETSPTRSGVKLITSDGWLEHRTEKLAMITGGFPRGVCAVCGAGILLVGLFGATGCDGDSEPSRPAVPVPAAGAGSGGKAASVGAGGGGMSGAAGPTAGSGVVAGAAGAAGASGVGGQPDDTDAGVIDEDGADAGMASETDAGLEVEDGGVEEVPESRRGHWTGMTSQREPLEFELTSAGLRELTVSLSFAGCDAESTTEFSPPEPLGTSPGFSLSVELDELGDAMFSGLFPGPNLARGVLRITSDAPASGEVACAGRVTWTASRDE
jgi:hypothetical protein